MKDETISDVYNDMCSYNIADEIFSLRQENKELKQELLERAEEHERVWRDLVFAEEFLWEAISRLEHSERVEVLALMRMGLNEEP